MAITEQQDIINGKLTSLHFVRAQNETAAESVRDELVLSTKNAESIQLKMSSNQEKLDELVKTTDAIDELLDSFDAQARTEELREWFGQVEPNPACEGQPQVYSCMVRNKLHADWDADFRKIRERIIAPIRNIDPGEAEVLEARIVQTRAMFDSKLDEDPEFWFTVQEKQFLMDTLSLEIERAFSDIGHSVEKWVGIFKNQVSSLRSEITQQSSELAELQAEAGDIADRQTAIDEEIRVALDRAAEFDRTLIELQDQTSSFTERKNRAISDLSVLLAAKNQTEVDKTEIETRLSKIQSPFGNLPIGLKEATLAFPVIIAVSFVVCASLLADLVRLHNAFHASESPAREQGEATSLLAHLWLEPVLSGRPGLVAVALLLPVGVFIVSVAVILAGTLDQTDDPLSDQYLRNFYYVLYAIAALFIVRGIRRVQAKLPADA